MSEWFCNFCGSEFVRPMEHVCGGEIKKMDVLENKLTQENSALRTRIVELEKMLDNQKQTDLESVNKQLIARIANKWGEK